MQIQHKCKPSTTDHPEDEETRSEAHSPSSRSPPLLGQPVPHGLSPPRNMVRTRSGLDTADEAPSRTSGCCKKFLRELVLFTLDMTILLFGVLQRPLCL